MKLKSEPGNYRFRVVASNDSGVWNEQGTALDFTIAPAYRQTTWFRALCGAAFLVPNANGLAAFPMQVRSFRRVALAAPPLCSRRE
jgi:hypothetical protein